MTKKTLFLHLGYPKTGSTFFQKEIMPKLEGMKCLHAPRSDLLDGALPWDGILSRFFERDPYVWSELGDRFFEEIIHRRQSHTNNTGNVLISDEVCQPRAAGPKRLAEHARQISLVAQDWGFSKTKVILVFRRQDTHIASAYAEVSGRIWGASQKKFSAHVDKLISPTSNYFRTGISRDYYIQMIEIRRAIGKDNLLMLPFEKMQNDTFEFYKLLAQFLETEETQIRNLEFLKTESSLRKVNAGTAGDMKWKLRPRYGRNSLRIRLRPYRLLNRLGLPTSIRIRWPDPVREKEICLTHEMSRSIISRYADSNRMLEDEIQMDLKQHGYY